MSQSKHQIQSLLEEAGIGPRPRFGQHFMIDQNLVRVVAEAGRIEPDDVVIEVGPGTGTLTEELLGRGAGVRAVEIDRALSALLRARFGGNERFTLIEGDALAGKHHLNPELSDVINSAGVQGKAAKLVANLPYNVASPLIIEMLKAGVSLLAFTVQKEVAERLRARAGCEAYGVLSIMAQLLSEVELLRTLPAQAFWPAPKVESALVRLTRRDRLGARAGALSVLVHRVFSSRRKMLRKALGQAGPDPDGLLAAAGLDPQMRPEQVTPEQFLAVFDAAERQMHQG
jgi:16S rRNA (adenine1518-N6/adenine1519-N6)-dimethyltransferase